MKREGAYMRGLAALVSAMVIGFAAPALASLPAIAPPADEKQDKQLCYGKDTDSILAIAACTRLVESGRANAGKIAIHFYNRGVKHSGKGRYDRAIEDYDKAIRLNPKFAIAWRNRGSTFALKRQYDRALEDFNEAIRLDPQSGIAYQTRGLANQTLGNDSAADRDFKKAEELGYAP